MVISVVTFSLGVDGTAQRAVAGCSVLGILFGRDLGAGGGLSIPEREASRHLVDREAFIFPQGLVLTRLVRLARVELGCREGGAVCLLEGVDEAAEGTSHFTGQYFFLSFAFTPRLVFVFL